MSETKQSIGAWKKQTSNGEVITFTIEGKKYSMWANQYKKEDKHPDFKIYEDNHKPSGQQYSVPNERKTAADNVRKEVEQQLPINDDLPF
jgi:uncharacterized protein (DUF736 family)